ncbi:lactonase family protein [Streptomyces sp. NPDC050560]|uniref:lactonase family protein n=1 Tax=Streptomyces sp. NPDC050560 TaxID=3365630 RepID=UPI00379102B6
MIRNSTAEGTPARPVGGPARRTVLGATALSAAALTAALPGAPVAAAEGGRRELLCVGTWDGGPVYGAWFDPARGRLTPMGPVAEASSNWVAAHPRRPVLYVGGGEDGGYVRAFRVDRRTGATKPLGEIATDGGGTGGGGVSYLAVDGPSDTLLVANFEAGLATSLPLGRAGAPRAPLATVYDTGSGPSPRQDGPHPHQVVVAPGRRFALVPDFGADRVFAYRFDGATGALSPSVPAGRGGFATPPGSGPRRLVFAPHGRTAYLLTELTAQLRTLAWHPRTGTLTERQILSIDSPGFPGTRSGAELALSRDGRFVYVSSRGENTLVVYAVAPSTGLLTPVQRVPCGGTTPWGMALHPGGRWLLVANKASGTVNVFSVATGTGRLTDTGASMAVPDPDGFALFT